MSTKYLKQSILTWVELIISSLKYSGIRKIILIRLRVTEEMVAINLKENSSFDDI